MQEHVAHTENIHQSERGIYLADLVYGANDGIITTFAVVSGAAGASLSSSVILILGMANLIGDGISMGMSNYLALKSQQEFQAKQRKIEEEEVEKYPAIERDEVREVLERWKIDPQHHELFLKELTKDKKVWVDIMMREELGIMEDELSSPAKHGLVTFVAFALAGFLPLIPYVFPVPSADQFVVSIIATAVALFVVGAARTWVTGAHWIRSGFQMLGVGALAAAAAYIVGSIVKSVFGITL